MELLLLLVLIILGFSFYGFICFCRFLFSRDSLPQKPGSLKTADGFSTDETNDVHAAERLLRHLYLTNQLSKSQYNRVRDFLEENYKEVPLRPRLQKVHAVSSFTGTPEPDALNDPQAIEQTETTSASKANRFPTPRLSTKKKQQFIRWTPLTKRASFKALLYHGAALLRCWLGSWKNAISVGEN